MLQPDISQLAQQQECAAIPAGATVNLRLRESGACPAEISWGIAQSWFGDCLIAATPAGICWLDLAPAGDALEQLLRAWSPAESQRDDDLAARNAASVFTASQPQITLHLCGTEFQLRVWQVLLGIAPGNYMTYGQIARELGMPTGARAVGGAVGANGVALLVPCHRVLPEHGGPGAYRWGADLKVALLQRELGGTATMVAVA